MNTKELIREQLDRKINKYRGLERAPAPSNGWIYSIRQGINMSLRQLGQRLSITPQSVKEIEEREKSGSISLKGLQEVARALDMHFVYGFVPKEKSLKNMIEKRAEELAIEIVERTSVQMSLEDQKITKDRAKKAIRDKKLELIDKTPRYLWD